MFEKYLNIPYTILGVFLYDITISYFKLCELNLRHIETCFLSYFLSFTTKLFLFIHKSKLKLENLINWLV